MTRQFDDLQRAELLRVTGKCLVYRLMAEVRTEIARDRRARMELDSGSAAYTAINNSKWDSWDCEVRSTVGEYNRHLYAKKLDYALGLVRQTKGAVCAN